MGATALLLFAALCLGLGAREAAADSRTVLYARMLTPRNHLTIEADVEIPDRRQNGSQTKINVRCLTRSTEPPRFKYALPVLPSASGYKNCSDDVTIRKVLEGIDLSPEVFESTACGAAAKLFRALADEPGKLTATKCAQNRWGSPPAGQGILLEGSLAGELVTLGLQFVHNHTGAGEKKNHIQAAREDIEPRRGRRSHDDDREILTNCVASSHQIAVPADAAGDVTFVLGLTGVGKSTVVQLLTNQDDALYSNETSKDEYTIWDGNDKIGSGVGSKTKVPELVTDPVSGDKLYDFPGFSDTSGACGDIVTASVLRKVAQSARSVKVVFVVAYHSMHKGSDRLGFVNLLRQATVFMPALYKYKESVALVVTKVPNMRRKVPKGYTLVPDNEVRKTVAAFLRQVIATLDETSKTDRGAADFYPRATLLVHALLQQDGGTKEYSRIGLFRKPRKAGRLLDFALMQDTKAQLQNMVYRSMTATSPEDGDFGLPLSPGAQKQVVAMAGNFAGRLQSHVNRIGQTLRLHFQVRRGRLLDIDAVRDQTTADARYLEAALDRVGTEGDGTPRGFLRVLRDAVLGLQDNPPSDAFRASLNDTALLEFLQDASEEKLRYQPDEWARPLQQLLRDLQGIALWYNILGDLNVKLSDPNTQRRRSELLKLLQMQENISESDVSVRNDVTTEDTGAELRHYQPPLDGNDYLLTAMEKLNVSAGRDEISKVQPDATMTDDLRMLLDSALRSERLQSYCETDEFGHYSSLYLQGYYVWMNDVIDRIRQGCENKIRAVYILSQHTLYIDQDLYLHDFERVQPPAQLIVVAPAWYVEGKRILSVDGVNGAPHGSYPDHSGRHGNAGRPGGPAGAIMAVGAGFVNPRSLTLRASGGRGGPGQDGASGRSGSNGTDPLVVPYVGKPGKRIWGWPPYLGAVQAIEDGERAAEGNNGGDGGVAGLGGRAGELVIKHLSLDQETTELPVLIRSEGHRGSSGTGGPGGKGGVHGNTVKVESTYFLLLPWNVKITVEGKGEAEDGQPGKDGSSTLQQQQPQEAPHLECSQYYLRWAYAGALGALWDRVRAGAARRFLAQLENLQTAFDNSVEQCGLPALVHNLADLETTRWQHRQEARSRQRLVPLYEALFQRSDLVTRQLASPSTRKRKALLTVRTAVLSTLRALRSPAATELVFDINQYLQMAERTVQQLDANHRVMSVRAALAEARAVIGARMEERRRLLREHVLPALGNAIQRLQETCRALPTELGAEQRRLAAGQRQHEQATRRLQDAKFRARALRLLTGLFSSVFGFFTGGGDVVTAVGGALIEESARGEDEPKALPSGESLDLSDAVAFARTAKGVFDAVMEETNNTTTHSDVSDMLSKISKLIRSVASKDHDQQSWNESDHEAGGRHHSKESATVLLALKGDALQQRESWLQMAEQVVQSRVVPLLDAMQSDLKSLPNIHNSSAATRFGFARSLRERLGDVRVALTPLTVSSGALAIPREISVCAELLLESLGALVAYMDQIDELQERHDVALSMGRMARALVAPGGRDDWNEDEDPPELTKALERLQETVSSNLVLEEYHVALHSFKQWVFPFVTEFQINEDMPLGNYTFESTVDSAQSGLRALLSKFQKYHSVVRSHDHYISTRHFEDPEPLYSWGPAENGAELDSLLEGNEVVLWADVLRSPDSKDAIKFSTIGLRLIATNASRQRELDEAFQHLSVTMTHFGESYYKCGSRVFVLSLQSQKFEFSVKRKADGAPAVSNKVYDKIKEGDMMISPFTLWKIRLRDMQSHTKNTLSSFKGEVRLVLEGNAQYVTGYTCDDSLDEFYSFEPSKTPLSTIAI